jgi:aspartyl-tRNA(Asn)/glutamyl-tRNA(Gln) amidotransferase subunit A
MSAHVSRTSIEHSLARADLPDARSVFTLRLDDEARAAAEAADAVAAANAPRAARFLGVPLTVKDNFDLQGHATTAGSRLLADAPPATSDATVVQRLRSAGFVLLGRTNMTEFAFSGLGLNPHYGTPLNPAFPRERRIPGGSSSGAAVSVALGIVPAAIGTDTGGSIRIPAAFCGLTGLKPTAGAVSREGVLPLSSTLDTVGVIAASVEQCAAVFDVIRDRPGAARIPVAAHRIRLGRVETYVEDDLDADVEQSFGAAVERLQAAGIGIERLAAPELAGIPQMMREASFSAAEAAAWHAPFLAAGRGAEYDPRVLVRIRAGESMTAPAYIRLIEQRRALIRSVAERMAGLDALIWPTVHFTAPSLESLTDDAAYHATNARALRNSSVANLLDGCAISIPCSITDAPVGLTLAALQGRDDHLLRIAAAAQSILQGA